MRSTPRRATASELEPSNRQKKLRPHDPYMMSTLMKTTGTIIDNEGGPYTVLEDAKYGSQVATVEKADKGPEPKDGTIVVDSEFSVRRYEAS